MNFGYGMFHTSRVGEFENFSLSVSQKQTYLLDFALHMQQPVEDLYTFGL
jgi:hypothetical protein